MRGNTTKQIQQKIDQYNLKFESIIYTNKARYYVFSLLMTADRWNVKKDTEIFCTIQTHYRYNEEFDKMNWIEFRMTDINTKEGTEALEEEFKLSDYSRWNKTPLVQDMKPIQVSSMVFDDMLNCLPPKNWVSGYFEVGEPDHHDSKGRPIHRAFFKVDGKYYTGYPVKGKPTATDLNNYRSLINSTT